MVGPRKGMTINESMTAIQINVARLDERLTAHMEAFQKVVDLLDQVSKKLSEISQQAEITGMREQGCMNDLSKRLEDLEETFAKHEMNHIAIRAEEEKRKNEIALANVKSQSERRNAILNSSITLRNAIILAIITIFLSGLTDVILNTIKLKFNLP